MNRKWSIRIIEKCSNKYQRSRVDQKYPRKMNKNACAKSPCVIISHKNSKSNNNNYG